MASLNNEILIKSDRRQYELLRDISKNRYFC